MKDPCESVSQSRHSSLFFMLNLRHGPIGASCFGLGFRARVWGSGRGRCKRSAFCGFLDSVTFRHGSQGKGIGPLIGTMKPPEGPPNPEV